MDTVASPVAEAVTEETFADQCKAAGIDFTYEDPNASIYDFQTTDAAVDVITHASGKAKYVDETDGPCIRTPLDLAARSAVKVKVYYWIADEMAFRRWRKPRSSKMRSMSAYRSRMTAASTPSSCKAMAWARIRL